MIVFLFYLHLFTVNRDNLTELAASWAYSECVCVCVWGHVGNDQRRLCGERPLLHAPEKLRPLSPSSKSSWLQWTGPGESSFTTLSWKENCLKILKFHKFTTLKQQMATCVIPYFCWKNHEFVLKIKNLFYEKQILHHLFHIKPEYFCGIFFLIKTWHTIATFFPFF